MCCDANIMFKYLSDATQEELEEGQKLKPLSLVESMKKNSVVQRTLDAMKAKHQALAEE